MHQTFDSSNFKKICNKLCRIDKDLDSVIRKHGHPPMWTRPATFQTLILTILEQQVSLASARASFYKLKELIKDFIPGNIIEVTDAEFRACGISRQKTAYLRALAEAVIDGVVDFESFSLKPVEQVRAELIKIKGIGNWTVDIYLMFSLQSPDILPLGDIGIISAIKDLWGLTAMEDIIAHTQNWAPYRTSASFFLWHYYLKKRNREFPH